MRLTHIASTCLFAALALSPQSLAQTEPMPGVNVKDARTPKALGITTRYQYVVMVTSLGEMVLELDHPAAPETVENFLTYVEDDFYNGTIFHRVMKDFMVQGGGFDTEYARKEPMAAIMNEADNGLNNVYGTIAMARTTEPHSATCQFFINTAQNNSLNHTEKTFRGWGYTVFGQVIDGTKTLEKIRMAETAPEQRVGGMPAPVEQIVILSVERISPESCADAVKAARATEAEAEAAAAAQAALVDKLGGDGQALVASKGHDVSGGTTSASGLWSLDVTEGEGPMPSSTSKVTVHYTGWLTDGTQFDSSRDRGQPATFPLNGVISGWTEGVGGMKAGGRRFLVIPSEMAYGEGGRPGIPPNATLVFDVELISIDS
jgi:peptidyl-prolyl cis-trans isomerase B (cyclophilin B)